MMDIVRDFSSLPADTAREKYRLGKDVRDWKVALAQEDVLSHGIGEEHLAPILYRPFDIRTTYYTGKTRGFICMPRPAVMYHMLAGENLGLLTVRQQSEHNTQWSFAGVTESIVESCVISNRTKEINYLFPLYLYPTEQEITSGLYAPDERRANLSPDFIAALEEAVGIHYIPDGKGERGTAFGPEDVLHYIYAVLHHPGYRARYADLLKIDFPRIPLPTPESMRVGWFSSMCDLGEQLVHTHLLRPHAIESSTAASFPQSGDNEVVRVRYDAAQRRVAINPKQFFENVPPEAWDMRIGGYQPARKWLEDRKGRVLTFDDIKHYQRVIVALGNTARLMREIAALDSGGMFEQEADAP